MWLCASQRWFAPWWWAGQLWGVASFSWPEWVYESAPTTTSRLFTVFIDDTGNTNYGVLAWLIFTTTQILFIFWCKFCSLPWLSIYAVQCTCSLASCSFPAGSLLAWSAVNWTCRLRKPSHEKGERSLSFVVFDCCMFSRVCAHLERVKRKRYEGAGLNWGVVAERVHACGYELQWIIWRIAGFCRDLIGQRMCNAENWLNCFVMDCYSPG